MIGSFKLKEFQEIVLNGAEVEVSEEVFDTVNRANEFLKNFSKDKIIYGINTGFGPMAQ